MIEIRDLTVRSEGREILSSFSLKAEEGRMVVISGPSGSGKTTVLRAVMGFIMPSSGEIIIEGRRLDEHSVWDVRQHMAYVPQELDMGDGTSREVLMRPFRYRASSSHKWDKKRVKDLLAEFMLEEGVLGQDIKELSGGEKQRLAFVSALLLERPVLVLDEVTTGLDPDRKKAILEHLKRRNDITAIVATHDEAFLEYADEVTYLKPVIKKAKDYEAGRR